MALGASAAGTARRRTAIGAPALTYMVVDPRHDHSLRIPRPDLSVKLGVPNACTRCHAGRPAEWAAKQVEAWYGHTPRGYQRYGEALGAASIGGAGATATELLQAVARDGDQPAIARATALRRLGPSPGPAALEVVRTGLKDGDPMVRRASVSALEGIDPALRAELLPPLGGAAGGARGGPALCAGLGEPRGSLSSDRQGCGG